METPQEMATRLYAKMDRRAARAKIFSDYYDGRTPLKFASPEFSGQTGELFKGFSDNWCAVVPDTTLERLVPMGFRLGNGTLDTTAAEAWKRNGCDVEISLALLEALVECRSFALVWRPDAATPPTITFKTQAEAVVEYEPGLRNVRRSGMTVWSDGGLEIATLWVRSTGMVYRFERERTAAGTTEWRDRTAGLKPKEPAHFRNPLPDGTVPLVELANRSRLKGRPRSEIRNVIPLQDAVNTLWAHLMTASDQLAIPARAVLGMDRPTREIVDDEGEIIGEEDLPIDQFRSDRLLWLEKAGAQIAEFSAADLTNYTKVIEVAVQHIAAQTRTPPHYLAGQMVNVSADALVASESGLVAKAMEMQRGFGASLQEIVRLEALAAGDATRAADLAAGSVIWRDAQFRSDAQFADALTKLKAIGIPDEALWEMVPGVKPEQIDRWKSMRDDQAAAIIGGNMADLYGPKPAGAEDPEAGQ